MRCRRIQDRLGLYALGGLAPAERERVESHLADCAACRSAAEQYGSIVGQIRGELTAATPEPVLPDALWPAVRSEIARARTVRWRHRAVAAASLAALALVAFLVGGRWWGAAGGSATNPIDPDAATQRWRCEGLRTEPRSSAFGFLVRGSTIFALRGETERASAAAIDSRSGRTLWQSSVPCIGYLTADDSRVFCLASGTGGSLDLVALSAADGEPLWRTAQAGHRPASALTPCPAVPVDGQRVCWVVGNMLSMLDARTGEAIWTESVPGETVLSCPALDGSRLFVAGPAALHCLSAESGGTLWRREIPAALAGRERPLLALAGERAYLLQTSPVSRSALCCMDLESGRIVWDREVPWTHRLLMADGVALLRGQELAAFDALTGEPLWRRESGGCGPLNAQEGLVYFVDSSDNGRICALRTRNGRPAWEIAGMASCDAFARVRDTGYVKTRQGTLQAISLAGLVES